MNLTGLAKGDPVRVWDHNHTGNPEGGHRGTVHSVGRKYLVATYSVGGHDRTAQVKLSDGQSTDGYRRFTVQTPEVADARVDRLINYDVLKTVGLWTDMTQGARHPDDELLRRLARVVKDYQKEHSSD